MKKPTKAQRHRIYKKALELFHDPPEESHAKSTDGAIYLCCLLDYVSFQMLSIEYLTYDAEGLPEFLAFKPRGLTVDNAWFGSDNEARIECLEKCIELTARKKKGAKK